MNRQCSIFSNTVLPLLIKNTLHIDTHHVHVCMYQCSYICTCSGMIRKHVWMSSSYKKWRDTYEYTANFFKYCIKNTLQDIILYLYSYMYNDTTVVLLHNNVQLGKWYSYSLTLSMMYSSIDMINPWNTIWFILGSEQVFSFIDQSMD